MTEWFDPPPPPPLKRIGSFRGAVAHLAYDGKLPAICSSPIDEAFDPLDSDALCQICERIARRLP